MAQFFLCFLVGCSSGILNFLAGLFFLGAVIFLIAQETKMAMAELLAGFLLFMIPILGEGIVTALALLQKKIIALVRGE